MAHKKTRKAMQKMKESVEERGTTGSFGKASRKKSARMKKRSR